MKAKKSLGQNFLKNRAILKEMVVASRVRKGDLALEVGPGKGSLTDALLKSGIRVIAIEKDTRLIDFLKEKFAEKISLGFLEIVHGDILTDYKKIEKIKNEKYSIVANIPYYITGAFIRLAMTGHNPPETLVVMVQKEVAERILAKDGKESVLSIATKAYGSPKLIKVVSKKFFSPQPKVDSAILLVENISKEFFSDISEKTFFHLLKSGFKSKRKKLSGNLKEFGKLEIEKAFEKCALSENVRAEELPLGDWKCLAEKLRNVLPREA